MRDDNLEDELTGLVLQHPDDEFSEGSVKEGELSKTSKARLVANSPERPPPWKETDPEELSKTTKARRRISESSKKELEEEKVIVTPVKNDIEKVVEQLNIEITPEPQKNDDFENLGESDEEEVVPPPWVIEPERVTPMEE